VGFWAWLKKELNKRRILRLCFGNLKDYFLIFARARENLGD